MSNEKHRLRPVPPPAPLPRDGGEDVEAREWLSRAEEDEELRAVLANWTTPDASPALDAGVLAAYREQARGTASLWKRLLTTKIAVPVPVAAVAVVALLLSLAALVLLRGTPTPPAPARQANLEPQIVRSASEPAAGERVVEVPVVRERVLTRVVYVERERAPKRRGEGRRLLLSAPEAQEEAAAAARQRREAKERAARASMAGFKPADDVKLRIIKGERFER